MNINNLGNLAYKNRYYIFFIFIGLIYFFNLFIDVMDIDAAQYASISMEMLETGNFLQVFERGKDFLDKPPMLFWMAAASYALFGLSTFAYKLPAVLVILLGIFSTYKFAQNWYDKKRARLAALIVATTQAFMLITNDIRTDGILTGYTIFAVWQLASFLQNGKFKHIILGSVGLAFAMMSKGPIAVIIVGAAIGSNILLNRQWKHILKWQWIAMFVFVLILLLPMCWGLYTQFDLHPEKVVYSLEGPSGLRFFFWTQSFGRITGEIYWDNGAPFEYFLHTIMWDFQPWVLFLFLAIIDRFRTIIKNKFRSPNSKEQFTFGGFVLVFLALSTSNFKLPHYIFPIFPFAAIFTADYLVSIYENGNKYFKTLKNIQFGLLHILFIMVGITLTIFFPDRTFILPVFSIAMVVLFYISNAKITDQLEKLITITLIVNITVNLIMATHFYPSIMPYQVENEVGKWVTKNKIPDDKFYCYRTWIHSLDFYAQRNVMVINEKQIIEKLNADTYILTDQKGKNDIMNTNDEWQIVHEYPEFYVSMLTPEFLYAKTRANTLEYKYLLLKTKNN